ncbi:hypothetical protein AgCh_017275 [Apium graveolens]
MMRAALMWKISDFPAPGMLSGWSSKGDKNKIKDKDKAREDCKELGLNHDLWIQDDGTKPNAPYVLTREQVHKLFKWIEELKLPDGGVINPKFKDLIRGPMAGVETYKGCLCNGYKFDCGNLNERTSQNSGVVVIGSSYKESYGNYYGRLVEVLKLHYHNGHDVILFKCHWFDHTTHVKMDRNRITTVNVRSRLNTEDVFILDSQAHQVCYVPSITNSKSPQYTVLTTKNRQLDENLANNDNDPSSDAAFQNDTSNASSSHMDTVVINDPSNFFIDLRNYENDFTMEDHDEDQNNNEDMSVDERSDSDFNM